MKIAILGAGGFVGSRAIEYFSLGEKAEVRAIVRRYAGLSRLSRFNVDWRIADAVDEEQLTVAFRGCDFVLHSIMGQDEDTRRCALPAYRAAERAGVKRIIYLSSSAVYGAAPAQNANESTPITKRGLSTYASAKLESENLLRRMAAVGNVEVVVLRPSIIIGPRSYWIAEPARQLIAGTAMLCEGGQGICNSIYIDNLLDAILLACRCNGINGELFLLGDDNCIEWKDYYLRLAELMLVPAKVKAVPKEPSVGVLRALLAPLLQLAPVRAAMILKPYIVRRLRRLFQTTAQAPVWELFKDNETPHLSEQIEALHRNQWRLSSNKAKIMLGYSPSVSVDEGLRRSVAWLSYAGLAPPEASKLRKASVDKEAATCEF